MPEEGTKFVEAFKAAVRPEPRRTHRTERQGALPAVVLCGDETAGGDPDPAAVAVRELAAYVCPDVAHRGARHALIEPGRLVAGPDRTVCDEVIDQLQGAELNGVGRLRLPEVALLKSLLDRNTGVGRDGDRETANGLRDYAYEKLCDRHRGLMALRWLAGGRQPDLGAGRGLRDFLFILLPVPLFYFLPRWLWTLRCDRRLLRQAKRFPWWSFARGREAHPEAGRFFDTAIAWRRRLRDAEGHEKAELMERAMWAALLSDLRHANRPGRLRPYRRRRRTRCVVLLSPPADGRREVFDRFLKAYEDACEVIPYASVVLVAGMRGVGDGAKSLADVAARWKPQRTPERQLARLSEPLPTSGTPVPPLPVPYFRPVARPGGELGIELTASAAALAVTAWLVMTGVPSQGNNTTPCLGGDEPPETSAPKVPVSPASPEEYAQARNLINEENSRVDKEAPPGHVRTVFYLGANRGNTRFGSGLPELRGVFMGQLEANQRAQGDQNHGIWLKVEVRDAGVRFKNAVDVARRIVTQAAENRDVIGVVGFAESRTESRAAISELTAAKIPVIITSSTANAMLPGRNDEFVHRISPVNSRETDVEAAFVRHGAIVGDDSGDCHTARAAVVVRDSHDLYSNELGEQFREKFERLTGAPAYSVAYDQNAGASAPPPAGVTTDDITQVARTVCGRLGEEDRTLLYWAGRAEDFSSFLRAFGERTTCTSRHLTVLGGNELTNAALAGEFPGDNRLRLYHTVHALPVGDARRTGPANRFSNAYADTWKNDLWRNDGHAAQGRDAIILMADAASTVSTGGQTVTSGLVQNTLYNGGDTVNRVGASGALRYVQGVADPQNKPVIILRHFDKGNPVPVLVCGAFTLDAEDDYTRWGPDRQYECPTDR
ncbi:ABC transporter substrate-binding protein [Streptomyces lavenduligriseus]|uniref:ABC transporter substrate-binding protein n=1 Tax=Streptomyces lavenduligriseus TaxID=67315 RepID=A0ABT0NZB8_9ACTN|nr:ABC transporter substrate-binding protein [Streptomyces lavenduligriseus]MCL3996461.1 ABC transporter substrate-binding protein [Streptomyces lavenduligriseus]